MVSGQERLTVTAVCSGWDAPGTFKVAPGWGPKRRGRPSLRRPLYRLANPGEAVVVPVVSLFLGVAGGPHTKLARDAGGGQGGGEGAPPGVGECSCRQL